ncbi:TIGR04283 family arsenosugar biosynthesis glycosyltransferase [Cognatishimia sp. F0-27]|uniref:TIGR04283 family arsenosugar biosynthesis glycosyltransferase n=1 Tax=Cognatishimia sp. F0-27 TaxID=2816855 RepID=UPI001D0C12C0|nr:TIGR04283 family arsenosugar biosynthesis glycosyltransferase [Cognatishimia sp. F0-27]MCC1494664.1 TIGR04283 family arsenosugar biosynthesis glycosyltransferase [Cognatishimia sp. F0-27]
MRAPLSVIIPTLNAETGLPATLDALVEGLGRGLIRELIVSDGGSTDATLAMADAAGARIARGAPSRGGQLRRGGELATGSWLLFLHADTRLSSGWSEAIQPALRETGAYYARLAFDAPGFAPRFVAGWANLRSAIFGLPYGDQGLLVDCDTYHAAGGYQDIPLMEDVAFARALPRPKRLPVTATTSAARYTSSGWIRRGGRNLSTLGLYFAGRDPHALALRYRR